MAGQSIQWLREAWSFLKTRAKPDGTVEVDTTNHRWTIHDGTTSGGIPGPITKTKAGSPTVGDLVNSGEWGVFKNTVTGAVTLSYNDSGTIKSVILT
jgi:hypothetical protein